MHLPVRAARTAGFTLLELVLAIVLLMLLSGALVFSFNSLQNRARLDEGVERLVTLVRYARAHAATSGRPLRFQLIQPADSPDDSAVRVLWEPDPKAHPGELADLRETLPMVEAVNELVRCRTTDPPRAEGSESAEEQVLAQFTLYPDGSADPGRLIVISRDGEDDRRFLFEIAGVTGELKRRELNTNEFTQLPESPLP